MLNYIILTAICHGCQMLGLDSKHFKIEKLRQLLKPDWFTYQTSFIMPNWQYQITEGAIATHCGWQDSIILRQCPTESMHVRDFKRDNPPGVLSWRTGQFEDQTSAPFSHHPSTSLVYFPSLPSACLHSESATHRQPPICTTSSKAAFSGTIQQTTNNL